MPAVTLAASLLLLTTANNFQTNDLVESLRTAPALQTESLGEPVKTTRVGLLLWAPNPDGKTWDVLQIYFPQYGGPNSIVVIDLGSGSLKRIDTPRGWNFHLCPAVVAPNGKLFISILDSKLRQKICIYDPARNELTIDAVQLPADLLGETHPLVLGTDGKLYAIGQHPTRAAAAARIDPDTLAVEFFGPIGPSHAPNACWGYSGAADGRFIYIASGKIPWYLVAFDTQTGKWEVLAETGTVGGYVGVRQLANGCEAHVSGASGSERVDFWLYQGKAINKQDHPEPPWPENPTQRYTLPAKPEVFTALVEPDTEGYAELWFRAGPQSEPGGVRTQMPENPEEWRRFRYQVPLYPQRIYRLVEMPDGRLLGTAGAYQGNFVFDPDAGKLQHLGKIPLSHYATAFSGGKVYMSGYPTSPLYEFDPSRPWTTGKVIAGRLVRETDAEANPRLLLYLGRKELAGTHKMYAAAVDHNGCVYFGGRWIRDGACGGIAWYDPRTGTAGGMWEPFSNYQVTHMAATNNGRLIVISTRAVDDAVLGKPRPQQAALFLLDPESKRLIGKYEPLPNAPGTGPIASAHDSLIVGWTVNPKDPSRSSVLYAVDLGDPSSPRLLYQHKLPVKLPVSIGSNQQEAWDFRTGPDGFVWTFMLNVLVRIDPQTGKVTIVGKPPTCGRIAFHQGAIYLGGSTELLKVVNLRLTDTNIFLTNP